LALLAAIRLVPREFVEDGQGGCLDATEKVIDTSDATTRGDDNAKLFPSFWKSNRSLCRVRR
jgi:hypothetical protein